MSKFKKLVFFLTSNIWTWQYGFCNVTGWCCFRKYRENQNIENYVDTYIENYSSKRKAIHCVFKWLFNWLQLILLAQTWTCGRDFIRTRRALRTKEIDLEFFDAVDCWSLEPTAGVTYLASPNNENKRRRRRRCFWSCKWKK